LGSCSRQPEIGLASYFILHASLKNKHTFLPSFIFHS
jgi:hypothetical protein